MNAFQLHQQVIENYRKYLKAFLSVKDEKIKEKIEKAFQESGYIPEPLVQFNPAFDTAEKLEELNINKQLPLIFGDYNLYKHQVEALKLGLADKGFVVTSGTGSGKSLTFLSTIFNHLLENPEQKGVKAILVYPMNALINSQEEEIKKYEINFLKNHCRNCPEENINDRSLDEQIDFYRQHSDKIFPITYAKYTGQEGVEDREKTQNIKPNIILTNYMMLELIMTRKSEDWMRDVMAENLKYLVFDELHTYRGRQGSDVSLLIRRIKALAKNKLTLIGTSATMASEGSQLEKKQAVVEVANTIFGEQFEIKQIIGEFLKTSTNYTGSLPEPHLLQEFIEKPDKIQGNENDFTNHPLSVWLENQIALKHHSDGFIERAKPQTISASAKILAQYCNVNEKDCAEAITRTLKWAESLNKQAAENSQRKSFLPFRFHQFISQTNTVYLSLDKRTISVTPERYTKQKNESADIPMFPALFSRYSGHEFICVRKNTEKNQLIPREPDDLNKNLTLAEAKKKSLSEADFADGYIVIPHTKAEEIWTDDMRDIIPDSWYNQKKSGKKLEPYYEFLQPSEIYFDKFGNFISEPKAGLMKAWYIPARLRIDPTAGIIYQDSRINENTKLMRVGNEGRSTATTILSYLVVKALHEQGETIRDQKLLSFTDNRQDASLQAGHFNDFLFVARLRSALYHALKASKQGLRENEVAIQMVKYLNLNESEYAVEPNDNWPDENKERALTYFILTRVLYDLRRGWRFIHPNLEQTAQLKIKFSRLSDFCKQESFFNNLVLFNEILPDKREEILTQILNFFRTSFAIHHRLLVEDRRETEDLLKSRLDSNLLWSLDKNERLEAPCFLRSKNPGKTINQFTESMGVQSVIGKYLNNKLTENGLPKLKKDEFNDYIEQVCDVLKKGNFLRNIEITGDKGTVIAYQLLSSSIIWTLGDGKSMEVDEVRFTKFKKIELKPNMFFQDLYATDFKSFKKPYIGKEHTGQLNNEDRKNREEQFRKGEISTLFCSPTMELGIDIANLNIVHMRNVPPNPANYAQRSGRAGRSGQTAIVFTYCSTRSPHDRNYFEASDKMVAGEVVPPRIELINEELMRTHFHAYILMRLKLEDMKKSVSDILDVNKMPDLPIKHQLKSAIENQVLNFKQQWATDFNHVIFHLKDKLTKTDWFSDKWLLHEAAKFPKKFDNTFARWRILYLNANKMIANAHAIINDPTIKKDSTKGYEALNMQRTGMKQISQLQNEQNNEAHSEFYIFRYLASEGFLPGYNFTKLPVRTFVGYSKSKQEGEYISRSRFIALKEFGPRNLIYHKGSKYEINQMIFPDAELKTEKLKISTETGYAFRGEKADLANNDPITKTELSGIDKVLPINNAVEITETNARPRERITSEEEDRTSQGFDLEFYFNYPKGIESTKQMIIKQAGTPLLNVLYGDATELIQVNHKWKRATDDAFNLHKTSGKWLRKTDLEKDEIKDYNVEVKLFARNTSDTLYIQPISELGISGDETYTLAYALKRAIELQYQTEESEIGVWVMGNKERPNILIYEAAEGSLGILVRLIEDGREFEKLFRKAYEILHFNPETHEDTRPDLPKAGYENILSYYNQPHHDKLDRFAVHEAFQKLLQATAEPVGIRGNRQQQYHYLLQNYDTSSELELRFIKYLYQNGFTLPDKAQVNIKDYYISVDFIFTLKSSQVLVFCDGSVHDNPNQKKEDNHKRQLLRDAGYDVIEYHYTEKMDDLVKRRKDIFRKIV